MTAAPARPSFFELLDLDPDAPWDEVAYQQALSTKQGLWAKQAGSGISNRPQTVTAKRNLNLLREMSEAMADPGRRDTERALARQARQSELAARRTDLVDRLDLMLRRGFLYEAEVTRLRSSFGDILTANPDLARRLDQVATRPMQPNAPPSRLDSSREAELRSLLRIVNAVSIYDVLREVDEGLTTTSPSDRLLAAAKALYRRSHQVKDKSDPRLTAWARLSGLAETLFADDGTRRQHDMSMDIEKLQTLVLHFEDVLGAANQVSAEQTAVYLERARAGGVTDLDLATRYFVGHFAERRWTFQLPPPETEEHLRSRVQCARCARLNGPDASCYACGMPLNEPCPKCGEVAPRYGGGCACGFPIGLRDLVDNLLTWAEAALDDNDLVQAEINLKRAARIWELPPSRKDPVTIRLHKTRERIDDARHRVQRTAVSVEALVSARRYVAALAQLREAPAALPRRDALLAEAAAAVQQAQAYARQARTPGVTRSRSAELCLEALQLCADLESARTQLRQIPLAPPGNVRAEVSDPAAGVLVTWAPSTDTDVTYTVVRAVGDRVPVSVEDLPNQRCLGTTATTAWRDCGAAEITGVPLHYAVFADRSGTYSDPALAPGVLVTRESKVSAKASDGAIVLAWTQPDHTVDLRLRRQELGTALPSVELAADEPGRLVDTSVRNGVRYRYTVQVAFRNPTGGIIWSPGVDVEAVPIERPAPPGPLAVTGAPAELGFYRHKTQLRWPASHRGTVRVIRQPGPGTLRAGDQRPADELRRDGVLLEGTPPISDVFFDDTVMLCSYVPVLVLDRIGYVGTPRRYARAAEVTAVHGSWGDNSVHIGWHWPEGCHEVLVGHHRSRPVPDATAAAAQLTVTRRPEAATGGCDIPAFDAPELHVIVARVVEHHGVRFATSGVPLHVVRPAVRIEYEIRQVGNVRRRSELVLRAAEPVTLPPLVLRAKTGQPPATREDGMQVLLIEPMRLLDRCAVMLPRTAWRGEPEYRLFTASAADETAVHLHRC